MKKFIGITMVISLIVAVAVIGCTDEAAGVRDGRGGGVGVPGHGLDHMFADHDANKDGKISKDEFPGPDEIFDRIDGDDDGFISEAEAETAAAAGERMRKNMHEGGEGGPGQGQRGQRNADPAARWAAMLEHLDTDNDGKISQDEFQGPDEAFDRIDANDDGFITEDEAQAIGANRGGYGGPGQGRPGSFARMDVDGDGDVTRDEWAAAFDKLDTNGDGVLNQEDRPERPRQGAPDAE